MALTDKLTAIGNAIRSKTGDSNSLTLTQMVTNITNLVVPNPTITYSQENEAVERFIKEVSYIDNNHATITVDSNITSVSVADTSIATVIYSGKVATITAVGSNNTYTNITINTASKSYSCGAHVIVIDNTKYISCMKGYPWEPSYKNYNPAGQIINVKNLNDECILVDGATGNTLNLTLDETPFTLYNLTPGIDSFFTEINNNNIVQSGILHPTGQCKMIYTKTLENLRDIGGWACDGGTIKYNKIIRGYTLDRINDAQPEDEGYEDYQFDKKILSDLLNIKQEVSLQNSSDIWGDDGTSSYYTDSSPIGKNVKYVNYDDLDVMYNHLITYPNVHLKDLFTNIFQAAIDGNTQYIHCAQGADRTGSVIYIIETLLGVSESDKDKDYELTSFSANRFRNKADWISLKAYINNLSGNSVQDKVVKFLISKGISLTLINDFRRAMINGNPSDLTVDLTTYSITKTNKFNLNYDNSISSIYANSKYDLIVTPKNGYLINNITVEMGNDDITNENGIVVGELPNMKLYNVSLNLDKSISANDSEEALGNNNYVTILTGKYGYKINSVSVTMNNTDITSDSVFYIAEEEE